MNIKLENRLESMWQDLIKEQTGETALVSLSGDNKINVLCRSEVSALVVGGMFGLHGKGVQFIGKGLVITLDKK